MSSTSFALVQLQVDRYGLLTILIFGNIGNVFIMFLCKNHWKNPCAMYLMSTAMTNILLLTFNIPMTLYSFDYGDPASNSMVLCKLRPYLSNVWSQMGRYFVALACIDRFALTSVHVRFRTFSRLSTARYLIGIMTIVWCIAASHSLVMTTIIDGRCGMTKLNSTIYTIYILVFTSLIPPVTMTIFGYLTYRNMKQLRTRIQPIRNDDMSGRQSFSITSRDRQLLTMVITEIVVYVISMSLYPVILFEMLITNYMNINKSPQYLEIESFIYTIATLLGFANNAAPFYIYYFASSTFRQDFRKLLNSCWFRITRQNLINVDQPRTPIQINAETHI
ncbi:unnamed protein product [Adineta steineri]|uniref:G-protein coupled receptors family 1 profile domain-containing protein n=1 Tax=Adineta steineri TaxID=433720 RepID=A0A819QBB5_9BILA|nr:unnamed protein product [Adineta steineri]CAF4028809.1 unnamed protein product [Adineta steineri]